LRSERLIVNYRNSHGVAAISNLARSHAIREVRFEVPAAAEGLQQKILHLQVALLICRGCDAICGIERRFEQ